MSVRYALITGASGGIGKEFAFLAAADGMNLILLARNAEKLIQLRKTLENLYPIKVLAVGCDLSDSDMVDKITTLLQKRGIVPDVLINNAGFGLYGAFDLTNPETEKDMIQVNIITLTGLTKRIYKQMLEKGRGRIMNVASVAGFTAGPLMSVYYATKAYVLSFSEALAYEAKGRGVSVTVLCPGPTKTNFENNASAQGSKLFKNWRKLTTGEQVAKYGWRCMMKGKTTVVHGWKNRVMMFFVRLFPRKVVVGMVHTIQKPVKS